jgi:ribulose-phosphate 3-epimerase
LDISGILLDIHLLVDDPTEWIEECVALKPDRIFAQVERMGNIEYFVQALAGYGGVRVGLGLGIATPLTTLTDHILGDIDSVLLMAIEPGYSGRQFDPAVITKIQELRKRWDGTIAVDGGINPETYIQSLSAGATEAGANTALWKGDFETNLQSFNTAEDVWRKK